MKISYEYDAAGNRTKKTADGVDTTYVYDPANRLTSETSGSTTITYGYDPRGNLTSQTEGSDVTSYEWDARNRLTKVTLPDTSSESYEYDAQDRRVTKVNASGTTRYVWDEQNLLQERDGSGAVQAHYTDAPSTWGGLTSQRRGSTSHFYGFDMQGSTRFLSDASGAVTDSYQYSAYGEELNSTGSTPNPFRYDGQWGYYRDNAERLYVRARHYQPSQGRWLSRDPIGFQGGDWNLYRYVGNNPVDWIDPSGLAATCSLYKYLYTGDWCASDEVYNAALDGGAEGLTCWQECFFDGNKQLYAAVLGIIATTPGWPAPHEVPGREKGSHLPNSRALSSVARRVSQWVQSKYGYRARNKLGLHSLEQYIKRSPIKSTAGLAAVVVSWAEAALSAYCASECMCKRCKD